MKPWMLASGDFVPLGGMDTANYALASYLARHNGALVHIVAHRVADDLAMHPAVRVHRVPRPFGFHSIGEPLLTTIAARRARGVRGSGGHVMANGGNVDAGDMTWAHYVHAVYTPSTGDRLNSALTLARHRHHLAAERRALGRARLVLCNSDRTAADVVNRIGVDPRRVRRVYYGIDALRFTSGADSTEAKAALGLNPDIPVVLFIGALGDRRKGFDTLLDAWSDVCRTRDWDAHLVVAGSGAELRVWQARAAANPTIASRITFLGYRTDVPRLLAASDLLVHPARYEAYGLAVHEALCSGVPALVSASAGVAERLPDNLRGLLLHDVESAGELVSKLCLWRSHTAEFHQRTETFGALLRGRSWDDMSRDIVEMSES